MPLDPRLFPTIGEQLDAPLLELELRSLLGGQVNKVHAATLQVNQGETIRNVFANRGCLFERRAGSSDVMAGVSPSGAVLGMGWWNPPVSPASPRLIAVVQGGIFDWDGTGDWRLISGGSFSGTEPVYFVQGDQIATGSTFATYGYFFQKGAASVLRYDGTTTLDVVSGGASGSDTSVPLGVDAVYWRGQLWVAEDLEGNGHVRYSEYGLPNRFDLSQGFFVNPADPIIRIVEWFSSGILVFQRNSISAIEIDQGNFDSLLFDSTRIVTLNYGIGCVAGKSVAQAGQDFYFLSRLGVMALSKTAQDRTVAIAEPISEPIRETIRRINWAHAHKATGVIWDGFYLLAIPVDGSSQNNFVIALDLEEGGWYEVTGWSVGDWRITNFPSVEDQLYFGTSLTAGAGEVYLAFDEDVDTDDGVDIDAQVVTARFDAGDKKILKFFQSIDVYTDATETGEIEVYAAADNGDFSLVGTITVDSSGVSFPITFPITFPAETLQRDTFGLESFGHVREMQFKFVVTGAAQTRVVSATVNLFADAKVWN